MLSYIAVMGGDQYDPSVVTRIYSRALPKAVAHN